MSTNIATLKFKVLGFAAAAVIGAAMLLGTSISASAATFTCGSGATCYNDGTIGIPTGDFTNNTDWQSDVNWNLTNITAGFTESQFGAPANKAVGAQSAANVETVMESDEWFDRDLFYVGQVDNLGGQTGTTTTDLKGNLYYYHAGNNSMAWFFEDLQNGFSVTSDSSAAGWSNLRVYSTVSAVPLPAAFPLFGAALLGLGYVSRRRKNKALQA